jgi:hypothetical protein
MMACASLQIIFLSPESEREGKKAKFKKEKDDESNQ